MIEIVLVLKILLYGILGHYILRLIDREKYVAGNFYSLYYALFSIAALGKSTTNILYLFLVGVFWASLLKLFVNSIDRKLTPNVNIWIFGLLNMMNFYLFDPLIDALIVNSSPFSVIFLFILGLFSYFFDLSLELRRTV